MPDPQPNAAAETAQSAPAQPATQAQDDGFERVSREELQTLRRNNERIRGMEGFYQKAQAAGFKRPEDLDRYSKFSGTLSKKGLTLDQIEKIMAEDEAQGTEPKGLDLDTITKELGDKFIPADKFQSELDRRDALHEHKSLAEQEKSLVSEAVKGLIPEGASARDRYLIERAVRAELADPANLRTYPQGHPLANQELRPHDKDSLAKIVESVKKNLLVEEGKELEGMGKAVNKTRATPAGSTVSQGKPKNEAGSGTARDQVGDAVERAMSGKAY